MINNHADLKRLLKLCREQGVVEIKLCPVEIKLGDLPLDQFKIQEAEPNTSSPYANFPQGELTPTQLIYYSSGGAPEDDPELKQ